MMDIHLLRAKSIGTFWVALCMSCLLSTVGCGGNDDDSGTVGNETPEATEASQDIVAATGGSVTLNGIAALIAKPGALGADATVTLRKTTDEAKTLHEDTAGLFGPSTKSEVEVKILMGPKQPAGELTVAMVIPPPLAQGAATGEVIRSMVKIVDTEEGLTSVELLPGAATPTDESLMVTIRPQWFYLKDGVFEAIVYLVLTRTGVAEETQGREVAQAVDPACRSTLRWPLDDLNAAVNRDYGLGVFNPATNSIQDHLGVDIDADIGTPVKAAAGGKVLRVAELPGYGLTVELIHPNGSATRYAHLAFTDLWGKEGQNVDVGMMIAMSGNSGDRTTGPHLHFEYASNGQLRQGTTGRQPPLPCIDKEGDLDLSSTTLYYTVSLTESGNCEDTGGTRTLSGTLVPALAGMRTLSFAGKSYVLNFPGSTTVVQTYPEGVGATTETVNVLLSAPSKNGTGSVSGNGVYTFKSSDGSYTCNGQYEYSGTYRP